MHLLHHSRTEVGWKHTKDQYYKESVRGILNGVVDALLKDKHRRFTYAEMTYFQRWFKEKSAPM